MGSAQSARWIQPGGQVGRVGQGGSPSHEGTASRAGSAAAGRISSVGGAPRPALGRLGRPVGKVARGSGLECYSPPAGASPFPVGAEGKDIRRAFFPWARATPVVARRGGTGSPCSRCDCRLGRTVHSAP